MSLALNASVPSWHPPLIFESEDIVRTPHTGQLWITSKHPKRNHTDREREAELNAAAQARWRANDKKARACYDVGCDADVLTMLVETGYILDAETGDDKIVGEALADMLADAAQSWKEKRKKF